MQQYKLYILSSMHQVFSSMRASCPLATRTWKNHIGPHGLMAMDEYQGHFKASKSSFWAGDDR
jgi:hypothetical protein